MVEIGSRRLPQQGKKKKELVTRELAIESACQAAFETAAHLGRWAGAKKAGMEGAFLKQVSEDVYELNKVFIINMKLEEAKWLRIKQTGGKNGTSIDK